MFKVRSWFRALSSETDTTDEEWRKRGNAVLAQPYPPGLWQFPDLRQRTPWYFESANGARVRDHDGREFIDLEMSLGPILLGYNHPVVTDALQKHAHTAALTSLLHRTEVEVAELLVEMIPSAETVVFGKNGSDACAAAARIARAATGRNLILTCGFHGVYDWFLADIYPGRGLVPPSGLVKAFALNNLKKLERLANEHSQDLAAIMIDPANQAVPTREFLEGAQRIAKQHGALLIFDEIFTAFRVHPGGAQKLYDVTPDLTCVGKALANGLPLSALVGRRDIMQHVDEVFYALTFQHESVALSASLACLRYYQANDVSGDVARKQATLRELYDQAAASAGLRARAKIVLGRTGLGFMPEGNISVQEQLTVFGNAVLERGLLPFRIMLPCEGLTEADIEQCGIAFNHACQTLARMIDKNGT
jgi:glutamate-1-semialdehyde aminotransferase